jgi:hypothetical protein
VLFLVGLASQNEIVKAYNEAVKALADLGLTTTLPEVITDLGLQPLSAEDVSKIRDELGLIIGRGEELAADSQTLSADSNVTVAKVQATLAEIADVLEGMIADRSSADFTARAERFADRRLSSKRRVSADQLIAIEKFLHGAETGIREWLDSEVALKIIGVLRKEIGHDKARERVIEFRTWPMTIAEACRRAAAELDGIKGNSGRVRRDWYPAFVRVLALIARKNGIGPRVVFNPRTRKAEGRFLDLARRFELLLPKHMRSASREAIAKALERSKASAID